VLRVLCGDFGLERHERCRGRHGCHSGARQAWISEAVRCRPGGCRGHSRHPHSTVHSFHRVRRNHRSVGGSVVPGWRRSGARGDGADPRLRGRGFAAAWLRHTGSTDSLGGAPWPAAAQCPGARPAGPDTRRHLQRCLHADRGRSGCTRACRDPRFGLLPAPVVEDVVGGDQGRRSTSR
jgi:hypothetical protein